MSPKPQTLPRLMLGLLLAALAAAAGGETPGVVIPRPDLSAMEDTAREKIESMQAALERLQQRGDARPTELAEAVGSLGQHLHAFRLLDSAAQCYEQSRQLAPDDPRWSYYAGLVRHANGDLEEAIADYEKALSQKPGDLPTLLRLGDALIQLDRNDDAKARYEQALQLAPDNAAALYGLGKVAGFENDYDAAVAHLSRVLELQPEATVVHYLLGQAYRRLGDMDTAREHLKQRGQDDVTFPDPLGDHVARLAKGTAFEIVLALAESADDYDDSEFLGFALSHFGDVRGSIEQLEQGLALKQAADANPKIQGRIHYVLGGLLVNDDRDSEAVTHFTRAIELAPELIDARVKLGNAYARAGELEKAIAAYDGVLTRQANNAEVLLKRVSALMSLDRGAEAKSDLEHLAKLTPDSSEVHVRLATVLEKSGDADGAIRRYRRAAELDLSPQERPMLHFRLATLLRERGENQAALEHYQKSVEADPGLAPAIGGLASLLAQIGHMKEAATAFGALVKINPDLLPPRMAEATALILSDQHALARDRLEAAHQRFPEDLRVVDVLARHLAAAPDRTARDGQRAVELALALFDKVPTPESVETLAMAYAEAGNFDKAREWQRKLLSELDAEGDPEIAKRLSANLALYERGQPCCAEPAG